jgi:hypothetical protein
VLNGVRSYPLLQTVQSKLPYLSSQKKKGLSHPIERLTTASGKKFGCEYMTSSTILISVDGQTKWEEENATRLFIRRCPYCRITNACIFVYKFRRKNIFPSFRTNSYYFIITFSNYTIKAGCT